MKKPVKPKKPRKPAKPAEPQKPDRIIEVDTEVYLNLSGEGLTLQEIVEQVRSKYPNSKMTDIRIQEGYYDEGCEVYVKRRVENESFEIQTETYKRQLRQYKKNLVVYKEKMRLFKKNLEEWTAQMEAYNKAYDEWRKWDLNRQLKELQGK